MRTRLLCTAALATLLSPIPALAQPHPSSSPILWVDSRPMLLAKLKAGDKTYTCHLLLDLSFPQPLLLHRNAAGSLKATACDIELGSIRLSDIPFEGKRDRNLESLTARFAQELHEVPVAGYLGLSAFGQLAIKIDGPGSTLAVTSPPPDDEGSAFVGDPAQGAVVTVEVAPAKTARFELDTRQPASFATPALLHELGSKAGTLTTAKLAGIDLAKSTPFRSRDSEHGAQGGFGGRVLRSCVLIFDLAKKRFWVQQPTEPPFPDDEAALCRALAEGEDALFALLAEAKDPAAREEAARVLFEGLHQRQPLAEERLMKVVTALLETAPVVRRANTALDLVKELPEDATSLREAIANLALPTARQDQNGEAQHALRMELGRAELRRGNLDAAYRSLLSAVFGMPGQGEPALLLGQVHEKKGELERARARYFQAMLDAKNTGEAGLEALLGLWDKQNKTRAGFVSSLLPLADGRVPALHPVPREPEEIVKTGHVVLVELFTGAQCPPCVAADLAIDAIAEHYGKDEVAVVVWHLPVPGPEPMITAAGMRRAKALGIRGTPTVRIGGEETLPGGGDQDAATKLFDRYQKALAPQLARKKEIDLTARAWREGKTLRCEATANGAFGAGQLFGVVTERQLVYAGRNGILFHGCVARAPLFGDDGVVAKPGVATTASLDLDKVAEELQTTIEGARRDGKPFGIEPSELSSELDVVLWIAAPDGRVLQATTVPLTTLGESNR